MSANLFLEFLFGNPVLILVGGLIVLLFLILLEAESIYFYKRQVAMFGLRVGLTSSEYFWKTIKRMIMSSVSGILFGFFSQIIAEAVIIPLSGLSISILAFTILRLLLLGGPFIGGFLVMYYIIRR